MRLKWVTALTATSIAVFALSNSGLAQTPPGLGDLIGVRGSGGENALRSRGYTFIRSQSGDDRQYSFWWNAADRRCITVAVMNGRYNSITNTTAPDCGKRTGGVTSNADHGDDRDRDSGYHPDFGYRAPMPQQGRPSYVESENVEVDGRRVELGLMCFGAGQQPSLATRYGWSWNRDDDRYEFGNRTELTAEQFDASLMIQIWSGGGRIRLPKRLIPPIHSKGSDGWWDLNDVATQSNVISAQYRLNGLNKPSVTIDRNSGSISIVGTSPYAFRGTCDLVDDRDHRRF